jgi:group I intron endonuclease
MYGLCRDGMIVYRAFNKVTGKSYVGVTTRDLQKRISSHYRSDTYFCRSLKKHGKKNFIWSILEIHDNKEDLFLAEEWYIRYYRSFWRENGYNLTYGGEGILGYKFKVDENWASKRPEIRKKISESVRKNHYMKGKHHTEEAKRKISESSKRLWCDENHRKLFHEKMSGENHPLYGKHHTEEAKRKIKEKTQRHYLLKQDNKEYNLVSSELVEFCKVKNLSYQMILRKLKSGVDMYKGYHIRLLN